MQKIPNLFLRGRKTSRLIVEEIDPECAWATQGEGIATEMFDGTCCLVLGGEFFRRHWQTPRRKPRKGWIHWSFDPGTTHGYGWLPVGNGTDDMHHRAGYELLRREAEVDPPTGTYELVGPAIQRNPYQLEGHDLWLHGSNVIDSAPRTFVALAAWMKDHNTEGIVFHHVDGRMAKVKKRDFGLPWPVKPSPLS